MFLTLLSKIKFSRKFPNLLYDLDKVVLHKVQVGMMCVYRSFKSVCAFAQSDQSLSFPPEETLNPWHIEDYDEVLRIRRLI